MAFKNRQNNPMETKIRINVTIGWGGWVGTFWGAKNVFYLNPVMAGLPL